MTCVTTFQDELLNKIHTFFIPFKQLLLRADVLRRQLNENETSWRRWKNNPYRQTYGRTDRYLRQKNIEKRKHYKLKDEEKTNNLKFEILEKNLSCKVNK